MGRLTVVHPLGTGWGSPGTDERTSERSRGIQTKEQSFSNRKIEFCKRVAEKVCPGIEPGTSRYACGALPIELPVPC